MTDSPSLDARPRPGPVPLANRNAPGAPNRGVTGLLRSGHGGSTPIPPSLQAKMAAVRSQLPISCHVILSSSVIDGKSWPSQELPISRCYC